MRLILLEGAVAWLPSQYKRKGWVLSAAESQPRQTNIGGVARFSRTCRTMTFTTEAYAKLMPCWREEGLDGAGTSGHVRDELAVVAKIPEERIELLDGFLYWPCC